MELQDVDNPNFIPTDSNPRTYLSLASKCHMQAVVWQRRGAAWEGVAKDVMKEHREQKEIMLDA